MTDYQHMNNGWAQFSPDVRAYTRSCHAQVTPKWRTYIHMYTCVCIIHARVKAGTYLCSLRNGSRWPKSIYARIRRSMAGRADRYTAAAELQDDPGWPLIDELNDDDPGGQPPRHRWNSSALFCDPRWSCGSWWFFNVNSCWRKTGTSPRLDYADDLCDDASWIRGTVTGHGQFKLVRLTAKLDTRDNESRTSTLYLEKVSEKCVTWCDALLANLVGEMMIFIL